MIYYISVTKEDVVLLTTNKTAAAKHIGVTTMTLYRAFRKGSVFRNREGVVYVTDFLLKQRVRGAGSRFKKGGARG